MTFTVFADKGHIFITNHQVGLFRTDTFKHHRPGSCGGGSVSGNPTSYNVTTDNFTLNNPTKTGYTFAGWDKEIPATMPAENVTIKAKWTVNQYTITFDADGGIAAGAYQTEYSFDYGAAVQGVELPSLTKEGYIFAGWSPAVPDTMPAEDVTIKATWTVNQYTITFDTQGGTEIAPITQAYGTAVTAPADPSKAGYTFDGWDAVIPAIMPAANLTVKATWQWIPVVSEFYTATPFA